MSGLVLAAARNQLWRLVEGPEPSMCRLSPSVQLELCSARRGVTYLGLDRRATLCPCRNDNPFAKQRGERFADDVVDLGEYVQEEWWRNDYARSSVHRLTHPHRPDLFVKRGPSLAREYERMHWCQGRLPVPTIVDFVAGETDMLVTEAVPGASAADRKAHPDRALVAELLAEAWQLVHALPIDVCPFDTSTDALLQAAEESISMTSYEVWDEDSDTMRSAAEVYRELLSSRPPPTPQVVVHGDACLPNVIIDGDRITGFVDLGFLGVGDAWWDLAACLMSMRRPGNLIADAQARFIDAYGFSYDPAIDRWYRLLYRLDTHLE